MNEKKHRFLHMDDIAVVIGCVIAFLLVYGVTPLDVTNDAWIMAGYVEYVLIQHYAGWVMFRSSEWSFPLGLIKNMAVGTGTMLTFTDSIPIVAILCKGIEGLLPETFQYFGWYILVCFVLQGIAAYKIVSRKVPNCNYCLRGFGTILLGLTPILLERSFRHTALGSQWIILFAILTFLRGRDAMRQGKQKFPWAYLLLNILCVLIHPYFLPMVMVFTLLSVLEYTIHFHKWIRYFLYLLINMIVAYGVGWFIGALGWGVGSARFGYGYFNLNLNALINPKSLGDYQWSLFLDELGQVGGNYDGFNYIGVGMLVLIGIAFLSRITGLIREKNLWSVKNFFRVNWLVLGAFFCLTVFAISNVVTWNAQTLFEIPIPDWLYWKCGIFRASARMFYPVYYCLFIYAIYTVLTWKQTTWQVAALAAGLVLQLADLSIVIAQKHEMMKENSAYVSLLDQEELVEVGQTHDKIIGIDFWDIGEQRRIAVWAGKNGMTTSFTIANSGEYPEADQLAHEEIEALKQGNYDASAVYVTQNVETYKEWLKALDESDISCYYYNDAYYIIP